MKQPVKKGTKPRITPEQQKRNTQAYMERNQVKRYMLHIHMADEKEKAIYDRLQQYTSMKAVIMLALEEYFKNNP